MSYQSGPFGPGYTAPPGGGGGPWGPPPGGPGGFGGPPGGGFGGPPGGGFGAPGFPPPPPPKKSNTGLIIGIVIAVVVILPICVVLVVAAAGAFAFKSAARDVADAPPAQPATPPAPAQPALPSAPQGSNGPVAAPAGYRAVRGVGFSYTVPATWQDLNPADLGSHLIESAQRNPVAFGNFMTNVNIAGEPFGGDGPAYGAANLIELQKVATIRDQRLTTSGTRSAWDIESFWPNAGGVPYVTVQRYVTNGSKGYVITCSAGSAVFSSQRATCETILSTFRVD